MLIWLEVIVAKVFSRQEGEEFKERDLDLQEVRGFVFHFQLLVVVVIGGGVFFLGARIWWWWLSQVVGMVEDLRGRER
ncbi:hypothetical protein HanIR_Chr03g0139461 [Helianthus annuus]|nr:hypothetical protein HanIR_Chr03g0139461 [Helianthus annuus]